MRNLLLAATLAVMSLSAFIVIIGVGFVLVPWLLYRLGVPSPFPTVEPREGLQ